MLIHLTISRVMIPRMYSLKLDVHSKLFIHEEYKICSCGCGLVSKFFERVKTMNKIMMTMSLVLATFAPLTQAAGIGVIDLERVVENSTYLKQENTAFQQKIQPQTTKIDQLSKELEALQQRAQANNKISDAEKQKMSAQYQAKLQELAQLQQTVQGSVQSSIQQIRTVFDGRVKQIAEQLRKENNLDVVLNKNSTLTYDAKYDLTDKMIQKVNAIK